MLQRLGRDKGNLQKEKERGESKTRTSASRLKVRGREERGQPETDSTRLVWSWQTATFDTHLEGECLCSLSPNPVSPLYCLRSQCVVSSGSLERRTLRVLRVQFIHQRQLIVAFFDFSIDPWRIPPHTHTDTGRSGSLPEQQQPVKDSPTCSLTLQQVKRLIELPCCLAAKNCVCEVTLLLLCYATEQILNIRQGNPRNCLPAHNQ